MDFSSSNTEGVLYAGAGAAPDAKIAPIVIAGAAFVGRAVAGGVIGGAATWGVNRVLDNRFPSKK